MNLLCSLLLSNNKEKREEVIGLLLLRYFGTIEEYLKPQYGAIEEYPKPNRRTSPFVQCTVRDRLTENPKSLSNRTEPDDILGSSDLSKCPQGTSSDLHPPTDPVTCHHPVLLDPITDPFEGNVTKLPVLTYGAFRSLFIHFPRS